MRAKATGVDIRSFRLIDLTGWNGSVNSTALERSRWRGGRFACVEVSLGP